MLSLILYTCPFIMPFSAKQKQNLNFRQCARYHYYLFSRIFSNTWRSRLSFYMSTARICFRNKYVACKYLSWFYILNSNAIIYLDRLFLTITEKSVEKNTLFCIVHNWGELVCWRGRRGRRWKNGWILSF